MRRVREALSHWGPWIVLAYVGLVAVTVTGFTLNAHTVKQVTLEQASVARCLTSRPQLARISTHLRGVNQLARVLVMNNRATVDATPASDPQRPTRVRNLHRLEVAQRDIAAIESLHVPSVAECHAVKP